MKTVLVLGTWTTCYLTGGQHKNCYQLIWIMILDIFLYIAFVYNEILIHSNGIFTSLGVEVDCFYLWVIQDSLYSPGLPVLAICQHWGHW